MPIETLNIKNESQESLDSYFLKNARSMAMAFASLNSLNSLPLESLIDKTYYGISSGFNTILSGPAIDLFKSSVKNNPSNSLVFPGYLGFDAAPNSTLSSINALGESALESLKCSVNAIFCSCSINKASVSQTRSILAQTLSYYSSVYPQAAYQLTDSIFSDSSIQTILNQNYLSVFSYINTHSPKTSEVDVYSYSFYDTTKIFSEGANYQLMADAEVQYYYVSGNLTYDFYPDSLNPCVKRTVSNAGNIYQMYDNLPCVDLDSSAAPINGLSFYRKFPDGPNVLSSEDLKDVYKNFNNAASPDFYKYSEELYSDPALANKLGNIPSDLKIFEAIDLFETGQVPQSPNETGYSSAHIGGSRARWRITGYIPNTPPTPATPLYGYVPMTGFKIVPISLNKSIWGDTYNSIRTNPDASLDSKLIRALNIIDHLGSGNVGGPVVTNNSLEIPCIFINEEFYNRTLGTSQSGSLYFGILQSTLSSDGLLRPVIQGKLITGGLVNNGPFQAGDTGSFPKINFAFSVSNSGITGENAEFAGKCFGMGDAGGDLRVSGASGALNVGYPYSEFSVWSGSQKLTSSEFFNIANNGIIGDHEQSTINYVDGFTSTLPSQTKKVYSYDQDGRVISYNYYQPGDVYGSIQIPLSGWDSPFPILDSSLTPVIATQRRENFHPRFYKGPYSSKRKPFLYPSASGVNNLNLNGFPTELEINLAVSEEIARQFVRKIELYFLGGRIHSKESNLTKNGVFNPSLNFKNSLPLPTRFQSEIGSQKTWSIPETLVQEYWAEPNAFTELVQRPSSIKDLFTGACVNLTGKIGSSLTLSTSNSEFSFGSSFPSGHYVIEYETGYYSTGVGDFNRANGPGEEGYWLIYSNTGIRKLDFSEYIDPASLHDSFYHTGGKIALSGLFNQAYTGLSIKVRLEKDCDLCEDFYFKYLPSTDFDAAGCKYMDSTCVGFDVSPEGMTPAGHTYSSPPDSSSLDDFNQGVRLYKKNIYEGGSCNGPQKYEVHQLLKIKTGAANYQYYYKEAPLYEGNTEFQYQTGRSFNLTLKYTLPEYSLFDRLSHPEHANSVFQSLISDCLGNTSLDSPVENLSSTTNLLINKSNSQIIDGSDPIWFERVGGNSGISGGYHSKGLFGDAWLAFNADAYGITPLCDGSSTTGYKRSPENDNYVLELNNRPGTELSLYSRALKLTPGYFEENDSENGFQKFDLTGIERSYSLANSSFDLNSVLGLLNSTGFEQYSYLYGDFLYPMPGIMTGVKYKDSFGRIKSSGVSQYWKNYINANRSVRVTGYKYLDKSRVNFKINSIRVSKVGAQILDIDQEIRLTGSCLVSGEFGYHSQAESAVFSEGVFLKDYSENYPLKDFYSPNFVSDVLLRATLVDSGSVISPLEEAPSRCLTRKNVSYVSNAGNEYVPHLSQDPYNYNKLIVPALSDLTFLNEGHEDADFERILKNDGLVFPNSTFLLNASIAQHEDSPYETALNIPDSPKIYYVQDIKQFYDSSVTDAVLNLGYFITSGRGPKVILEQGIDSSGFLAPLEAKYSLYSLGIYEPSGYADYEA